MAAYDDYIAALATARAAITSGDYTAARVAVARARLSLAAIPDTQSAANEQARWRADLDGVEKAIDALEGIGGTTGAIQTISLEYDKPTAAT
jgi:hypothetical protein